MGTARGKIDIDASGAKRGSREARDSVDDFTGSLGDNERQADRSSRANRSLTDSLVQAGAGAKILQSVLGGLKIPAFVQGISLATGAVGALSAGAVGLVASLAPLVGLLPAVGAGALAVAQGAGVAKLAFSNIEDGLKAASKAADEFGANSKQVQDALKDYSPPARDLIRNIIALKPAFEDLRNATQAALFPGVTQAIRTLAPLMNTFRPIVLGTATVLGDLARAGADLVASPAFSGQLLQIGQRNITVIRGLGNAALTVAPAILTVINAAGPLLDMLVRLANAWANGVAGFVEGARQSGALTRFFNEAQTALSTFLSILGSLSGILGGVGRAAYESGSQLLQSIDGALERFNVFVNTVQSQNALRDFFDSAQGPLREIALLIGDIGRGFGGMFSELTPVIGPIIAQIRAQLLPALLELFGNIDGPFLSALVNLATSATEFLNVFLTATPVLTLFINAIAGVLNVATGLIDVLGPLGPVVVNLIAAFSAYQTIRLFVGTLNTLRTALAGIRAASGIPTVIAGISRLLGLGGGITTFTGLIRALGLAINTAFLANPVGVVVIALVALGAAIYALYKNFEPFRNLVDGAWQALQRLWDSIINFGGTAIDFLSRLPETIGTFLASIPQRVTTFAADMVARAREMGSNFLNAVGEFFSQLPGRVGEFLGFVIGTAIRWGVEMIAKAVEVGTNFLESVTRFFTQLPGRVAGFLAAVVSNAIRWGGEMINRARETGVNFLNNVVNFIQQLPGRFAGFVGDVISRAASFARELPGKAREAATGFFNGIINGITALPGAVGGIIGRVITAFTGVVGRAFQAAKDFAAGLWNGFKRGLGIGSPSFIEYAMDDIVKNVQANTGALKRQIMRVQKVGKTLTGDFGMSVNRPRAMAMAGTAGVVASSGGASNTTSYDQRQYGGDTIKVEATTNANPQEISRDIVWAKRIEALV